MCVFALICAYVRILVLVLQRVFVCGWHVCFCLFVFVCVLHFLISDCQWVLGSGCYLVISDLGLGSPECAENTCLANAPFETFGLV